MQRPTVFFFSPYTNFSLSLVKTISQNYCYIKIFSDKPLWANWIGENSQSQKIVSYSFSKYSLAESPQYVLLLVSQDELKNAEEILEFSFNQGLKTIFVFPYESTTPAVLGFLKKVKIRIKEDKDIGIIYIPELVGEDSFLGGESSLSVLIKTALTQKVLPIPPKIYYFYPALLEDVAKQIAHELFSFGPYGREVLISSSRISSKELYRELKMFIPEISISYRATFRPRKTPKTKYKIIIKTNPSFVLKKVVEWMKEKEEQAAGSKKTSQGDRAREKIKAHPDIAKYASFFGIFLFFVFVSPFLFLLAGLAGVSWAAPVSSFLFDKYAGFPVVGKAMASYHSFASTLETTHEVLQESSQIKRRFVDLIAPLIYGDPSGLSEGSDALSLDFDSLYQKTSFWESDVERLTPVQKKALFKLVGESTFSDFRNKLLYFKIILANLPEILGSTSAKSYLILFEDNLEIRPTGGKPMAFSVITFEKGVVRSLMTSDVSSADAELLGIVTPPAKMKDYLGVATWTLRDYNWDPDFPTSSQKAQWFLERELDKKTDGVIVLDSEAVRRILEVVGSLTILDGSQVVEARSLFPQILNLKSGGQDVFFKSLLEELIAKTQKLSRDDYAKLVDVLLKASEERHVQYNLAEPQIQKAISGLSYDGGVTTPSCPGNCLADWVGLAETNVGRNRANNFVSRDFDLSVNLGDEVTKRTLVLNFQNKANLAFGTSGNYKTYVRLLLPRDALVENAEVLVGERSEEVFYDLEKSQGWQELGVYLEISPLQRRRLRISWQSPNQLNLKTNGEYRLYVRKQAGTLADKIKVALTGRADTSYNSTLAKDFFAKVSW